ncbi:MAG: AraC family transcriptional regulator [Deltaproteobacteria bacterium]|nr:AraC family transcriptional regulator [Deltaproteobacteria bacterium]
MWSMKAATITIFFGSFLAFLLALEQQTRKKPNLANLLFSGIFLCCAVIIWGAGAVANSLPPRYPFTIYLFFTAICVVGPLYYLYFRLLLHPETSQDPKAILHFIPGFGAFLFETGFQFFSTDFKKAWLAEMFDSPPQHLLMILVITGALHASSYLIYLLKMDMGLVWNVKEIKTELRLLVIIDIVAILSVVALFLGFTFKVPYLFEIGGNMLALLTVCVFLGYNRYPDFFQMLKAEIEKTRYDKSSLTGVDTDEVKDRLIDLLRNEKIFTESDLNLKRLADLLALTPHQLSEYLNEHLKSDFRSFINSFRVDEAKELLTAHQEKSILTICYEVGFGSKSTFNAVFKKETGLTPSEFRDASQNRQG